MGDEGSDDESPVRPTETSSGWTINWRGVLPLLLIAAITLIAWRQLDGATLHSQDDDEAQELDVATTSVPADDGEKAAHVTSPSRSTTTNRPDRTTIPATSTTVAPEPQVLVIGEVKPCRFGSECLVASFSIEGFEEHPGRFTCIYPNSRSDFVFHADHVDDACLTADDGDTITIEIDGVRSATISEQNLDGTT